MISLSILNKKCSITGELVPIDGKPSEKEEKEEEVVDTESDEDDYDDAESDEDEEDAPEEEKKISAPKKVASPKRTSPPKKSAPQFCPCIIKRTGKVCGARVKEFGVCGRHKGTCVLADGNVVHPAEEATKPRKKSAKKKSPEKKAEIEAEEKAVESLKSPSRAKEDKVAPQFCPCNIKQKSGAIKVCGRPIKAFGVCGLHKNKCVLSDGKIMAPSEAESPRVQVKRRPRKKVVEESTSDEEEIKVEIAPEPVVTPKRRERRKRAPVSDDSESSSDEEVTEIDKVDEEKIFDELEAEIEARMDEAAREEAVSASRDRPESVDSGHWNVIQVENIEKVYEYLVNIPEETIDLGDQVYLADEILKYLKA